MYQCPLCTNSSFNYATLNSLSSHIDAVHCPITGPTNASNDIILLESRINKFLNYEVNQTHLDVRRKTFSVTGNDRVGQNVNSVRSAKNRNDKDDLLYFPKDYEFVKLENEHLKQRLRDLERISRRDVNEVDEKNASLQNDLHNVTSFLKDAQRTQERSKKELQKFINGLVTDLEQKETLIFELNQNIRDMEQEQLQPSVDNPLIPSGSRISLRSRKPSGQSLDSGYQDGLDFIQKHHHITPVRQYKRNQFIDKSTNFDKNMQYEQGTSYETKKIFSTSEAVLGKVFRYLDTIALLKCSTVCRKWKKVAEHPIFWRRIRLKNVELTTKKLKSLTHYCSLTNGITLKDITANLDLDGNQRKTKKGMLEHDMELIFKTCGDSLTFLQIIDCCPYLTDRTLWLASCHCRNLKELIYISQNFPLSAPVIWSIGASCRNIETLIVPLSKKLHSSVGIKVDNYLKFDDNCLLMVARCWPKTLKTLCISGIHVTLSGLAQIAQHCEILQTFEIENYSQITLNDAKLLCKNGWSYLQKLNFIQTKVDSGAVLWFCERLSRLQTLLVLWKTDASPTTTDDYFHEIAALQNMRETKANVDKILRVVLQKS